MASPEMQPAESSPAHDLSGSAVGRFRVTKRLGTGGMGEVYAATDTTLKRTVALKRLAPRLHADPQQVHRMIKEAQRASALNHPNIAAVYDVFQEQGEVFLVLEYVQGRSLRERMLAGCSRRELLDAVLHCAEALSEAHARGIVHGDVKPENIMLGAGGQVKLLDFGVARRISSGPELTTETVGRLGGTAGYAAPEVLLEQDSDGRSDLFSLGVILYEAFGGQHPFLCTSAVMTLDRTLHRVPPPLASAADVPAALPAIVQRLLAKNPAERYGSAADLLLDLRACGDGSLSAPVLAPAVPTSVTVRIAARRAVPFLLLFVAVVGVAIAFLWWAGAAARSSQTVPVPRNRLVAILPFRPAAMNADEQAFADGVSDAVTTLFIRGTRTSAVQVAPYTDVLNYHVTDAAQARKLLGATVAVEGALHRTGDTVQLDYSIADTASGRVYVADQVSAPADSPPQMERRILEVLARALQAGEPASAVSPASPPSAAQLDFLRGNGYLQKQGVEAADSAISAFSQALARDPQFEPAYAELGLAYVRKFRFSHEAPLLDAAADHCAQALKLQPNDAAAHLCSASVYLRRGRNQEAVTDLERAVKLDPTSDDAWALLGEAYRRLNRMDEAERSYVRGTQVRPDYWASHSQLADFYVRIGRYQDAVQQLQQAVRLAPDMPDPAFQLGGALLYAGQYQEAISALKNGLAVAPNHKAYSNLGSAYLSLGQFQPAVEALQQAYRMDPTDFVAVGNLARAYYWAGNRSEAAAKYDEAIRLGENTLKVNPRNADAVLLLADYFAMEKKRSEALRYLAQALQLSSDDAETWYFAAIVRNQFGMRAETMAALQKSAAMGYSRSEIRNTPELANLRQLPDFQALVRAR